MIDARFRIEEVLKEKLPSIKQIFIEKYGEKYSDVINEKIDSMTFIPFFNIGQMNFILTKIIEGKTKEYIIDFFKKNGIEPTKDNIKKYFAYNPSLKYQEDFNLQVIYSYKKDNNYPSYWIDNLLSKIEIITGERVEYQSSRFYEILEQLNEYKDSFNELLSKYDDIKTEYAEIFAVIKKEENDKKTIEEKYEKEYIEFIKPFMNQNDQLEITKPFFYIGGLSCFNELIGYSHQSQTLYDAFTKESFEILNGEESYAKKSIIEDQIKYFQKHGIDVSVENFAEFRKSPQYQENLPDLELVEKIVSYRKELHQKELRDILKLSPTWELTQKIVMPMNLKDPKTEPLSEILDLFLRDQTCVVTYYNDKNERTDLLLFNLAHFDEYLDNALIHEMEHIITSLKGVIKNDEPGRSGFEIFIEGQERRYEQINEIINEIEAQETTTLLHQNGIYILNTPDNAKIQGGTSYERNRFLVNNFFSYYKETIRLSRINTDISIMYEEVGKENFEALVDLVNSFTTQFDCGTYYQLLTDLNNNKDTELTKIYYDYYSKSQEILNNMKNYKQQETTVLSA